MKITIDNVRYPDIFSKQVDRKAFWESYDRELGLNKTKKKSNATI